MSDIPPGPSFMFRRGSVPFGMRSFSMRAFRCRTYAFPERLSQAAKRALINAWCSHGCAQRE